MSKLAEALKKVIAEGQGTQIAEPSAGGEVELDIEEFDENPEVEDAASIPEDVATLDEMDFGKDGVDFYPEVDGDPESGLEDHDCTGADCQHPSHDMDMGPGSDGRMIPAVPVREMQEYIATELATLVEENSKVAIDKQAFNALFEGEGELTEDFKNKAADLFESACNAKVETLLEDVMSKIVEGIVPIYESKVAEMENNVATYAKQISEQWLVENQVAIESTLRTELAESFMGELKKVFLEHYIEIPENRVNLIESLQTRVIKLEEEANAAIKKTLDAEKALNEANRNLAFSEATKGMTEMQIDKVKKLSESIEFTNAETFIEKIKSLNESATITVSKPKVILEDEGATIPDVPQVIKEEASVDPTVAAYVKFARERSANI